MKGFCLKRDSLYFTKYFILNAVYVLHAFNKKTQKTAKKDIEIGKQCYQAMMEFRKQLEEN